VGETTSSSSSSISSAGGPAFNGTSALDAVKSAANQSANLVNNTTNNNIASNLTKSKDSAQQRTGERPNATLKQTDSALNPSQMVNGVKVQDTTMQNYACYFMSIINQAERVANKHMTADEINAVRAVAQATKTKEGKPALYNNMNVNDSNIVGTKALEILGVKDKVMVVGGNPLKDEKASGTIIKGKAYDSNGNPYRDKEGNQVYHYKSGDANGNEVYNPADNIKNREDRPVLNVYIRQKPKE
jgi:hypothetical protein